MDTSSIRWATKPAALVPAGALQGAAPARSLAQVLASRRQPPRLPWANAMRLELDHQAELSRIEADAYAAAARRLRRV